MKIHWLQVKDGVITATLEERPKKSPPWPESPAYRWIEDATEERQWLSTFREVEDQISAQNKLPASAITPDLGFGTDIIPGLYRVEAEAEVVEQWKTYEGWTDIPHKGCINRQVIRIKN